MSYLTNSRRGSYSSMNKISGRFDDSSSDIQDSEIDLGACNDFYIDEGVSDHEDNGNFWKNSTKEQELQDLELEPAMTDRFVLADSQSNTTRTAETTKNDDISSDIQDSELNSEECNEFLVDQDSDISDSEMDETQANDKFTHDYKDYITVTDLIYRLDTNIIEIIFQKICSFMSKFNVSANTVINMIFNAIEYNLKHLTGYYDLYQKIKEKYQVKITKKNKYIAQLDDCNGDESKMAKILDIHPENSVLYTILYDNIKDFQSILANQDIDFFDEEQERSLIDWCCFYGSYQCFTFLRNNGVPISIECIISSFCGRNDQIIGECLREFKPNQMCLYNALMTHNNTLALHISSEYNLSIYSTWFNENYNLEMFLHYLMHVKSYNYAISASIVFEIPQLFSYISKKVTDVNEKNEEEEPPLFNAVRYNNVDFMMKLISLGADIHMKGNFGYTALFIAAENNSINCLKKLIQIGAEVNEMNQFSETAMFAAARSNSIEAIIELAKNDADVNARNVDQSTPLFLAARENYVDAIKTLAEQGANVYARNSDGETALFTAARGNCAQAIDALIGLGLDVNATDSYGRNALYYCEDYNSDESASILIRNGATRSKNKDSD